MSKFNKLITKIGVDKVAHFGIGGLITAIVYVLSTGGIEYSNIEKLIQGLFMTLVVFVISLIKEHQDDKFDWFDVLAGVLGSLFMVGIISITFLF